MTWIINFFKSIGGFIVSIGTLIIDAFKAAGQIIKMLPQYIDYATSVVSVLPAWINVFCIGIIAISAVWAIRKAL